jgi:STE24 endopeptidase
MARLGLCMEEPYKNDMLQAYIFTILTTIVSMVFGLPGSIYATFVIEEKWGYNKTTAGTFVCDQIKTIFLTMVLTAIFLTLILWVI